MKTSRRSFLRTSLSLPALTLGSTVVHALPSRDTSFDPWVEVHPGHLRHNVGEISRRVEGRPILAVIKNNGYGLGLVNVASALQPLQQIAGFAVVKLQEALTLRDAQITKPILLMGPFDEENLEEMAVRRITPMVYTPFEAMAERVSRKLQNPIALHVCIDTGIGRVGIPYKHAIEYVRSLAALKSVSMKGFMMTFTEDPAFDKEQLHRFQSLCASLEHDGIHTGMKHAVSSFGLFQHPDAFLDMVRPGMAIFGIYPEKEFRGSPHLELRPAVSLKTRVIYVKQLSKGDSAGYNRTYMAQSDIWVATLPVGHADGVPRVAAKGARVRIGASLFPVVAISASHCIVELGVETRVRMGDVATVFDWQEGSRPEDVAAACGGSVYDLTMHLNPLLPRRMV